MKLNLFALVKPEYQLPIETRVTRQLVYGKILRIERKVVLRLP